MKKFVVFLVSLFLLGTSCTEKSDDGGQCPVPTGEVNAILSVADTFGQEEYAPAALSSKTRTGIIGDAGLDKVSWSETDKILLWATPDDGAAYPLDGEQFSYYTPKQGTALFSAIIPAMEEGTYTYYGAYPLPAARSGSQLTYNLPAEQDGTYNGALDIMLARPAPGPGLSEDLQPGTAALAFAHKCHILRIQVPENRNYWGVEARKLRIKFPEEVVGTLTFDALNPDAAPGFANGSNTVTLNLQRPLDESVENAPDGNYVWVFLRPGVALDGPVEFTAYSAEGYQSQTISTTFSKTLLAGKITPVTMSIPQELPVSYLDLSIGDNHLGEDPIMFAVTAPEGATLRNGTTEQTFTVDGTNQYKLGYYETIDGHSNGASLREGLATINFDSESANVSAKQSLTSSLTVPYLFEEDFSEVSEAEKNGTEELSGHNLPGWSGCRYSLKANTSARIWAYLGSATVTNPDKGDNHRGRLDTSFITGLKEGKTVTLSVSYNVSGTTVEAWSVKMYATYGFGTDTRSGTQDGDSNPIQNIYYEEEPGSGGSFTNIPLSRTVECPNCTNKHRFSWRASFRAKAGVAIAQYTYIYIDNIKVSIVK